MTAAITTVQTGAMLVLRPLHLARTPTSAIMLAALLSTQNVAGQGQTQSPCSMCGLGLTKVASILPAGGSSNLIAAPLMASAGGAYIIGPTRDGSLLTVDKQGAVINRIKPAYAGGPVELTALRVSPEGRIYAVFTDRLVIASPTTQSTTTIALPWRPTSLTAYGHGIAAVGPVSGKIGTVPMLTVFDSLANIVRSFPLDTANSPTPESRVRYVVSDFSDGFWVSHFSTYEVNHIDRKGVVQKHFVRRPPWFTASPKPQMQPFLAPPSARILGIRPLPRNRLMVLSLVADSHWTANPLQSDVSIQDIDLTPLYDTVVEILDASTGAVLATHRMDQILRFVYGSEMLWSTRRSSQGQLLFDLYAPK